MKSKHDEELGTSRTQFIQESDCKHWNVALELTWKLERQRFSSNHQHYVRLLLSCLDLSPVWTNLYKPREGFDDTSFDRWHVSRNCSIMTSSSFFLVTPASRSIWNMVSEVKKASAHHIQNKGWSKPSRWFEGIEIGVQNLVQVEMKLRSRITSTNRKGFRLHY